MTSLAPHPSPGIARPTADGNGDDVVANLRAYALAIETMEQGVLVYDGQTIVLANARLAELLSYPDELVRPGACLEAFVAYGVERGDYAGSAPLTVQAMRAKIDACEDYCTERCLPCGRIVRVDCRHRDGLGVVSYTDITAARAAEREIADARAEAELASVRLETAVEALDDAFGLYDADERLVLANTSYRGLDPKVGPAMVPGADYASILRRAVNVGFWSTDERSADDWVAERLRVFREGLNDQVYRSADGRWFLSRDRKLPGGERVCIRIDVTGLKEQERALEQSREQARFLADNDGLTGLANRRAFDRTLTERLTARQKGDEGPFALILLDLDRFKPVNDTHGHGVGDGLLRILAERFRALVRTDDMVARIGGDEFAVVARVSDDASAIKLAERLRLSAHRPAEVAGIPIEVGACAGVAVVRDGETPFSADALMSSADIALYAAKAAGRGRAELFEPAMANAARARRVLEADLRSALRNGEIELHYQVQRDLKCDRVVGYEALMRWHHPERGLISPADFIPIAEQTGLVVPLGAWAVERACRDFALLDASTRVSVNVSPIQFARGDVPGDVRRALDASGLDPARLEIEVTEEVLIEDTDATLRTLDELRALGVGLSLDDFGSGYSSLAYLTRFPFSKIKIDRQFIDGMLDDRRSGALVRSILAMADSLGLKVTAEGVETHGQLLNLAKGRCDEAQGFLLGRPMPFAEILRERDVTEVGAA